MRQPGKSNFRRSKVGEQCNQPRTLPEAGGKSGLRSKAKFGGMTVSEAKRLKALEDENAKLKKLLAEQMLDLAAIKELVSKKW